MFVLVTTVVIVVSAVTPEGRGKSADTRGEVMSGNADKEVVVFRKRLDPRRELVIVKSPTQQKTLVSPPLMPAKTYNGPLRIAGFSCISFQVASDGGSRLTLGARLVALGPPAPASGGFDVLDVLVDDGVIVVAVTAVTSLQLWRLTPYGDPQATGPLGTFTTVSKICPAGLSGWSSDALASYLDRKSVAVKLTMIEDGRIQADVEDIRLANRSAAVKSRARTRFIQVPGKWLFEIVKLEEGR
jgi:hypothetical protein